MPQSDQDSPWKDILRQYFREAIAFFFPQTAVQVDWSRPHEWVLMLPEGLDREFWQELRVYEEERRMPYISSVERIGFEEGHKQGLKQGLEQGLEQGLDQGSQQEARSLVLRLLVRRVGELPDGARSQIDTLSRLQLEALAEALLDFTNLADLKFYLANLPQNEVPASNQ